MSPCDGWRYNRFHRTTASFRHQPHALTCKHNCHRKHVVFSLWNLDIVVLRSKKLTKRQSDELMRTKFHIHCNEIRQFELVRPRPRRRMSWWWEYKQEKQWMRFHPFPFSPQPLFHPLSNWTIGSNNETTTTQWIGHNGRYRVLYTVVFVYVRLCQVHGSRGSTSHYIHEWIDEDDCV